MHQETFDGPKGNRLVLRNSDRAERRGVMAALDSSQCLIWFDPYGRILDANENMQALLGRSLDDLKNMNYANMVGDKPSHLTHTAKRWHRVLMGDLKSEERGVFNEAGREIWSTITYAVIRDGDANPRRVLAIVIDLSPWSWKDDQPSRAR